MHGTRERITDCPGQEEHLPRQVPWHSTFCGQLSVFSERYAGHGVKDKLHALRSMRLIILHPINFFLR